jgi:hypothetical protein
VCSSRGTSKMPVHSIIQSRRVVPDPASEIREWEDGVYGKDLLAGGTWLAFGKSV